MKSKRTVPPANLTTLSSIPRKWNGYKLAYRSVPCGPETARGSRHRRAVQRRVSAADLGGVQPPFRLNVSCHGPISGVLEWLNALSGRRGPPERRRVGLLIWYSSWIIQKRNARRRRSAGWLLLGVALSSTPAEATLDAGLARRLRRIGPAGAALGADAGIG
jgi:hypothetical protein